MEAVQKFLHQLLQTGRYGGRTVVRDERTLIVYDTPSWSERESRAVRRKFPECEVAVQAFEGSMSGFIVIVSRQSEPWGVASEAAFVLAAAGALWLTWCLHGFLSSPQ